MSSVINKAAVKAMVLKMYEEEHRGTVSPKDRVSAEVYAQATEAVVTTLRKIAVAAHGSGKTIRGLVVRRD